MKERKIVREKIKREKKIKRDRETDLELGRESKLMQLLRKYTWTP